MRSRKLPADRPGLEFARPVVVSGFNLIALLRQGPLFVFYPRTFSPPIGSFLPSLYSALPPPHPGGHIPEPEQVLGGIMLGLGSPIPELPLGLEEELWWEDEDTSLVKQPSGQSTPCHPVSHALELSSPPTPGD